MKVFLVLSLSVFTYFLNGFELPTIQLESSKIEDSPIENSQTINVINEEKIETSNIKDIKDLSSIVSNTNISGIGNRTNTTITIRGISNYVALESSVAMYIDDVPVPFSYGFGMLDMKNIKSIEVLKGSQGTLFGKGAQAGVINVYTKGPSKTFKSKASVAYSSYNTKELYAMVSGPTANKDLTYSFSLTKDSSDGFVTNELTTSNLDYKDYFSTSAKLRYKPNKQFDISLNYTKSKSDDGGSPFTINTKENPFSIDNEPKNEYVKMDTDILSLIIKYKQSDYSFTSATTYAKEKVQKYDYVPILGGLGLGLNIEMQELTQELRLKKDFDNSELLIGGFYSDKLQFDYLEEQTLYTPALESKNSLNNPDENIALFTQYKYFFNDNYSLMGALRYQRTKRSFTREFNQFASPTTDANSETTWTHVLPTISFSYLGDDNSNTYFTYAKGYRPGGYNYRSPDTLLPFEPEKTDSFELGYKKIYSKALQFSSALFYNIITDHRVNTFSDTLSTTTLNISKAYTYGFELDVSYKKDDLFVFATYGYTQAKVKGSGKNLIEVPDMTASVGVKYNIHKNIYVKSDLRYMGERYYNIDNTAKEGSYTLVNASVAYTKNNWEFELFANNIFDKRYVDFMIYTPSNNYYHFGNPAMFGIKTSASF
ncbi:MAG: TonB-dependent receptor [Sulfurimonas sp.]|nr:TonB-dependent receptor [Sulfurimonas sp.]